MTSSGDDAKEHLLNVSQQTRSKISVRELWRYTDAGVPILRGISLEIPERTIIGLIGPSGSGKSTFLRSLNRLWEPPSNSVFIDGEDTTTLNVISVRRRVGMLFQLPALFKGTVADNVIYGPSLQGRSLQISEIENLLILADLNPSFAKKSVVGLSVGQAQRVALARALANNPEVLLLDEPTSALDPISTKNIEDTILKLRNVKGLTTVLVSHSIKQVQRIADIVCLLVDGEVVEILKPNELANATHPLARKFFEES